MIWISRLVAPQSLDYSLLLFALANKYNRKLPLQAVATAATELKLQNGAVVPTEHEPCAMPADYIMRN